MTITRLVLLDRQLSNDYLSIFACRGPNQDCDGCIGKMDMINSSIVTTALNAAALAGKISPVPMTKSHGEANLNELKTNAPTAPLQDEPR